MFGSGLDAREVRARAGFGEQLAPDLAGDDPGQEAELLLRGAVGDDGRSGQVLGDAARGWGHPGIAAGVGHLARCVAGEPAAVGALRPGREPPAGVGQPLRSEEHTSELQSLMRISYAVFCLKKKNTKKHATYD